MPSTDSLSDRVALLSALGATEADLAINRQGEISADQKASLQKLPSFFEAIFTILMPLALGIVLLLPAYFTVSENPGLFAEALTFADGNVVMGAIFTIAFAGIGLFLIRIAMLSIVNPLRLRKSMTVMSLEGPVTIKVQRMRKAATVFYYLQIQGQSFFIAPQTCQLIREGSTYRVFYEPIQKHILSMEVIDA